MRVLRWLVLALSLGAALGILVGLSARWWVGGDTLAALSLHAAVVLIPGIVVFRRNRPVSGILMAAFLTGVLPTAWAAWEARAPGLRGTAQSHPVASANLDLYNDKIVRPQAIRAALTGSPTLVVLLEAIESADRGEIPSETYPHQVWLAQPNRYWRDSVALLSRVPILSHQFHDLDSQPWIEAVVQLDGRPLTVFAVHTTSPVSPRKWAMRNQQLRDIGLRAAELTTAGMPLLLMGDCNLAVASPIWRDLHGISGLRRPAQHEPASWPSGLGPLGVTIDHILAGGGLTVGDESAFDIPGSDHRGLHAHIALP